MPTTTSSAAPPLPATSSDFAAREYWDAAFAAAQGKGAFEWYGTLADLMPWLSPGRGGRSLVLGCGNSTLSHDLVAAKMCTADQITSLDFSPVVIAQMQAKYPKLAWVVGDMLKLEAQGWSHCFDSVWDKGALDALVADDSGESKRQAHLMFRQIRLVLSRSGTYYLVSLLQTHVVSYILEDLEWTRIEIVPFDPADGSSLQPFLVKLGCDAKEPSISVSNVVLSSRADAAYAVKQAHQSYAVRLELSKPCSVPSVRAQFTVGPNDRFHLAVVDSCVPNPKMACACLILPMGREVEYNVRSERGKLHLAKSNGIGRLIIVSLGRNNPFGTSEQVQKELSPVVRQLAPKSLPSTFSIPFLAVSEDLGQRERVGYGHSSESGDYVVEDVLMGEGTWHRRLVFLSDPFAVQSECFLDAGRQPDTSALVFELHQCMVASLGLAGIESPERVGVVGLGGGGLASFISTKHPNALVLSVEWDAEVVKVARAYFGFKGDCIVDDGVQVLRSGALGVLDALFIDVDSKDARPGGVLFPPPGFVALNMLRWYRDAVLKPNVGVLALNFECDGDVPRTVFLRVVQSVFANVRVFVLDELGYGNMVLVAWGSAANAEACCCKPVDSSVVGSNVEDFLRVVGPLGVLLLLPKPALPPSKQSPGAGEDASEANNSTTKKKKKNKNKR